MIYLNNITQFSPDDIFDFFRWRLLQNVLHRRKRPRRRRGQQGRKPEERRKLRRRNESNDRVFFKSLLSMSLRRFKSGVFGNMWNRYIVAVYHHRFVFCCLSLNACLNVCLYVVGNAKVTKKLWLLLMCVFVLFFHSFPLFIVCQKVWRWDICRNELRIAHWTCGKLIVQKTNEITDRRHS